MPLTPIHTAQRPTYPQWGTRIARSLHRAAIVAAATLLPLGCSAPLPGVPVTPTIPTETQSDQPTPDEVEPREVTEEWVNLPIEIWFLLNRHDLDESDRAMLREVQLGLEHRSDVLRIRVEGHVFLDQEPDEGLALARSNSVVDYMVDELGMPRELFEAVDGGDGAFYSGIVSPDLNQFTRVSLSILVRRTQP